MSDYLWNLMVIVAYGASVLGGCFALAFGLVPGGSGEGKRDAFLVGLGALLLANFFAMAASGLEVRA